MLNQPNGSDRCSCKDWLVYLLEGFQPPPCLPYDGTYYVTYDDVLLDGEGTAGSSGIYTWGATPFAGIVFGTLYNDAGCTDEEGGLSGSASMDLVITQSGLVYTVVGTMLGVTVFSGSGLLGVPIANTVPGATGTITLSDPP